MTLNDYTFLTSSKKLDKTIQSIKEKILSQGENIEWKINLVSTGQDNTKKRDFTYIMPNAHPVIPESITSKRVGPTDPKSISTHQREQPCERIIRRQAEQIKDLVEESSIEHSIMKNIYILKREEDELRHLNELNIQNIKMKKLKKTLTRAEEVIKSIDNISIRENDMRSDKERLILDKYNLLRKLKIADLRLKIREVELKALRNKEKQQNNQPNITINQQISPVASLSPPIANLNSPVANIKSPVANIKSPVANLKSPVANLKSPVANSSFPVASLRTPVASPCPPAASSYPPAASLRPPIASLSALAGRLLTSTRQSEYQTLISHLPKTIDTMETSPKPTFINGKRKSILTDDEPVERKPKAIKLTYKDQWTHYEDNLLLEKVKHIGTNSWEKISKFLPYRSSSECFRRYQEIDTQRYLNSQNY